MNKIPIIIYFLTGSIVLNVYKELRKEKGLTQIELAQRFQIDQTTVSKWELGRAIPDVSMLCKLSDFFDVSVDYLLGRTQFYYPDNIKSITTDAPNNKNENDSACANNMHNYGAELKYQREAVGNVVRYYLILIFAYSSQIASELLLKNY